LSLEDAEAAMRQADAVNRQDLDGFLACLAGDVECEEDRAGSPLSQVFRLGERQIARRQVFLERADALGAAGLAE